MTNQEYVCCICGKKFTGWGNNPWPVVEDVNARCCDVCNNRVVLTARISGLKRKENNK